MQMTQKSRRLLPRVNFQSMTMRYARLLLPILWAFLLLQADVAQSQVMAFGPIFNAAESQYRSWVDVNNDGRDDYCVMVGDGQQLLRCYLSQDGTFKSWGADVNVGVADSRPIWSDVNGDGKVDVCRLVGRFGAYGTAIGSLRCKLGITFTLTREVDIPFYTYEDCYLGPPRCQNSKTNETPGLKGIEEFFVVDLNGDSRADVCYFYGPTAAGLRCKLAIDTGWGAESSDWQADGLFAGSIDWPRGFFDFNADGWPDYCRIPGDETIACRLSSVSGFTTSDPNIKMWTGFGYASGASFIDINGDGNTDFCRVDGSTLRCRLSDGKTWLADDNSSGTLSETGFTGNRWWADVNGDGYPDFCRAVGIEPKEATKDTVSAMSCRPAGGISGNTFAASDIRLSGINFGRADGGRTWCDPYGRGISTFCRATYSEAASGPEECWESEFGIQCYTPMTGTNGIRVGLTDVVQARQSVMETLSDGVGAETRITYLPLTNASVYKRTGYGTYPRALIGQPPTQVVYETRAWKAGAGSSQTLTGSARYFYGDLRFDTWAGSRGFRDRWIFTEGSNVMDHVKYFQGLGPTVDATSVLNDHREIGLVKTQEKFAVENSKLPTDLVVPGNTPRQTALGRIFSLATSMSAVPLTSPPTSEVPFMLLQTTTNELGSPPANTRFRYTAKSTVKSWDWNNVTGVAMPTSVTQTTMDDFGNATQLVQSTTDASGNEWKKTTTNIFGTTDEFKRFGRLTRSTVASEAPSLDTQIGLRNRSYGTSPSANKNSGTQPAVPQPMSPGVMSAIVNLLLDD
jgi:FG-GAP-like repeat